jgi:hypothetical protein
MQTVRKAETRNRHFGGNRTPAIRKTKYAEQHLNSEIARSRQAPRIQMALHCSNEMALALAHLAYGEGLP